MVAMSVKSSLSPVAFETVFLAAMTNSAEQRMRESRRDAIQEPLDRLYREASAALGWPLGPAVENFGDFSQTSPTATMTFSTHLGVIPIMDEKERARALDVALGQIEKQFGKGSILRLGSKDAIVPVSVISTGSISLDSALGVGGFPRGRINEIFGPESSGKTTIALQVIAEAQKKGGIAAFIDVEHALDPVYAKKLGVDIDNLLVSQPDYGEQALEITNTLTQSGQIDVLVVDSVAALVPKAELEGER